MRCIEMAMNIVWLFVPKGINRNMRCIEIDEDRAEAEGVGKINRNMRCIEMLFDEITLELSLWLIETWDVLK